MIGITTERVALPETCLYLRPGRFAFNNRLCDSLFRLKNRSDGISLS
ncbi:Uncharacterised protein [Neisseria meningitidis]|nr:Uncharacterised protein [Neisseria meningitidis]